MAVCDMVELIAVNPSIAVVSRLKHSFNPVSSCRPCRSKDITAFVSRFRGFVSDSVMNGGLFSSFKVGEVLAIFLLNNAALREETLRNAKFQLVTLLQGREK